MQPVSSLILPHDAAKLLAYAQAIAPELTNFSHSSDCVKAQDGIGRFVHFTHRGLRKRMKADAAAAKTA